MTSPCSLIWITPNAEEQIVYCARVSNPQGQSSGDSPDRLIRYLLKHKHWSPFEMASMCVEINTTRDISAQILRHRSFSFQEFSQRYAEVDSLGPTVVPELRLQDKKNRQSSLQPPVSMVPIIEGFEIEILDLQEKCREVYGKMVDAGIAKECARKVLPIGSPSRLYMSGTIRSWIHYLQVRLGPETQKEHREVAESVLDILKLHCPIIIESSCLTKSISQ